MRGFRDRDYVQTVEDLFFCVVGSIHPVDRVISYLKYVPDAAGLWGRENMRYRRALKSYTIPDLEKTFQLLKKYPDYIFYSHVMDIKMSAVSHGNILAHFQPEVKLSDIFRAKMANNVQLKVVELVHLLSDESGVPIDYFGVTGSILLDIHQDFSDIDLVVYGIEHSNALIDGIRSLHNTMGSPLCRLDERIVNNLCLRKTRIYPISFEDAHNIVRKKWDRGLFKGTFFSIHPVKLEDEMLEKYGDYLFRSEGMMKIEATLRDVSGGIFLPSIYKIEDVKIFSKRKDLEICELCSYDGFFSDIGRVGERVEAYGKLEKVFEAGSGKTYHRVLIGSREGGGSEYIKLIH